MRRTKFTKFVNRSNHPDWYGEEAFLRQQFPKRVVTVKKCLLEALNYTSANEVIRVCKKHGVSLLLIMKLGRYDKSDRNSVKCAFTDIKKRYGTNE